MKERARRIIAAPFTPMTLDDRVDLNVIERQAELLHRNGVSGGFVCGTTGEGVSLTMEERTSVARRWVESAPDGFEVIVHVGHTSLPASKELARHASEIGARGTGAMGPCFFRPRDVDVLVDYCAEVAGASPGLPFYYYHMPAMTGVNVRMLEFLRAAAGRIPNLAGVKFTHEDLADFTLCCALEGGRFDMLFGRDEILLAGLAMGAKGAVGSTYNYAAPLYLKIWDAFERGDLDEACTLQRRAAETVRVMLNYGGGPGAGKAIMKLAGLDCGPCRLPLVPVDAEAEKALEADLREIGFFEYCCE